MKRRLKCFLALMLFRMIDRLFDVTMDKPVYLVFTGEGQVEVQITGQPKKTFQL